MEELRVVYEDNHIIVVVKPQNLPTQEDESKDKDLLTIVKEYMLNSTVNFFIIVILMICDPFGILF